MPQDGFGGQARPAVTGESIAAAVGIATSGGMIADRYIVAQGQGSFLLTRTPLGQPIVLVNGLEQRPGDYSIAGQALTWTSTDFSLAANDNVDVLYL